MKLTANYLKKHGYNYTKEGDNLTVGGSLYLRGTNITALPDNLTVGSSLYLSGTNITALPDNLTVGGSLDLNGTNITALPDNLTVGGSLDLRGTNIKKPANLKRLDKDFSIKYRAYIESRLTWHNGKYRVIDGIFCEVLKTCLNVIKAKIEDNQIIYIFTKDGINAHGKTIKSAYRDWLFKTSDRDVSQYENLDPNEKHDHNFWIMCYRTITGACSLGTENFLEHHEKGLAKELTLNDVIKATEGQYGHNTFVKFFKGGE